MAGDKHEPEHGIDTHGTVPNRNIVRREILALVVSNIGSGICRKLC